MAIVNFEFKAGTHDLKNLEHQLLLLNPKFIGEDNQTDTYFNVAKGRLKLREGNIENSLIWYERQNITGAKQSDVLLYQHTPEKTLKDILIKLHGIKVIVEKKRKIYFIGNVKFHFDTVTKLGTFIEVEAIDTDGKIGIENLKDQCNMYAELFNLQPQDYISLSYSDMLLERNNGL
jgi:adenylate cyclase class 2